MDLKGSFLSSPFVNGGYEKENNSWYAGGRIGYLITPNLLTYASGGYTEAHFSSINFPVGLSSLPSQRYGGYFVGGGAETSLSPWLPTGWFLRTDYKVSTYNAKTLAYAPAFGGASFERVNPYVQQVGTELIYRFNFH
jgi:outer membrane immunogenic protein